MKLDYDCVREVLLKIEEMSKYDEQFDYIPITVYDISDSLNDYGLDVVYYTLRKLEDGGYINAVYCEELPIRIDQYCVTDITFAGHEYLNNVRDPKTWKEIKSKLSVMSFNLIMQIAPKIITAYLGL